MKLSSNIFAHTFAIVVMFTILGCGHQNGGNSVTHADSETSADSVGANASDSNRHSRSTKPSEIPPEIIAASHEIDWKKDATTIQVEQVFDQFVEANRTPDESWNNLYNQLLAFKTAAVPVLKTGLQSNEVVRREAASTMLAALGPDAKSADDVLVAALKDESIFVRSNVAATLSVLPGHEEQVLPVLVQLAKSDDDTNQMTSAIALGNLGPNGAAAVPQLIDLVKTGSPQTKQYACLALGQIGSKSPQVIAVLNAAKQNTENSDDVRTAATESLKLLQ